MRFRVELSLYPIRHENPAPQKRKRAYRHRVKCSECEKKIVAEYQDAHARTKHIGKKVKFTISRAPNQSQLGFTDGDETITNMVNTHNDQTQLTPESHHRVNAYYASIDKVLSELELRFSGNDNGLQKFSKVTLASFETDL